MSGTEAECEFIYNPADRNEHLSGNVYYYSETEVSGCWHYDEGGMPILWN